MRLVVLSRSRFLHTTRWFVAAAKLRGHDVRVAAPLDCTLLLDHGQPRLLHRSKLPYSADAVISRFSAPEWEHGLAVLRILERMGVPVLNSAESMQQAHDRLLCAAALAGLALPVPSTALVARPDALADVVQSVGGVPCLLAPALQGHGSMAWLSSPDAVTAAVDLAQDRFVVRKIEPAPRVLRAFIVGPEIAGAVTVRPRWPAAPVTAGDAVELPEPLSQLALRAASGLGLGLCGVDIVDTAAGPMILDVDAMPNLRGIHPAVRKAVVAAVIKRVEAMAVARIPV